VTYGIFELSLRSTVEWLDGSQDGREAASAAGYKLRDPSEWYVYGPTYTMENIAAGGRKAAALRAQEASDLAEAKVTLSRTR
jgi:hypothetical protein